MKVYEIDSIRPITTFDLPAFLEIRNLVRASLHDDQVFSLAECMRWFSRTSTTYFGVFSESNLIGYFRLLRLDQETLQVGLDLHPSYQGKGLGHFLYLELFSWLLKDGQVHNLKLRVLRTNTTAIALYKKIGFRVIRKGRKDLEMERTLPKAIEVTDRLGP